MKEGYEARFEPMNAFMAPRGLGNRGWINDGAIGLLKPSLKFNWISVIVIGKIFVMVLLFNSQ